MRKIFLSSIYTEPKDQGLNLSDHRTKKRLLTSANFSILVPLYESMFGMPAYILKLTKSGFPPLPLITWLDFLFHPKWVTLSLITSSISSFADSLLLFTVPLN